MEDLQAKAHMSTAMWLYYSGGATAQQTVTTNVESFRHYRLRPKALVDVTKVETWVSILGKIIRRPVGIGPTPYQQWASDNGDIQTALAAQNKEGLLILSAHASKRLEDVRKVAQGVAWQEVYLWKQRSQTEDLVQRAEAAGIQAIVVTIDRPVNPINYDYERGLSRPPSSITNKANFPGVPDSDLLNPAQTWEELGWLKNQTTLPLVLKGVLTAEAARRASAEGVSAVIVSNHGGR